MTKYLVDVFVEYSGRMEVEADNEDDAGNWAIEQAPSHITASNGKTLDLYTENVEAWEVGD